MACRDELEGDALFGQSGFDQGDKVCLLARVWIVDDCDRLWLATFLVCDFPSLNALEFRNEFSLTLVSRCFIIEDGFKFRLHIYGLSYKLRSKHAANVEFVID